MIIDVETRNKATWERIWNGATVQEELSTVHYARSQEEIVAYLRFLSRSKRILEAGCGVGRVVIYLRESGFDVVGVDYCANALQKAKDYAPDLPLTLADIRTMPFEDGTFQAYLSFGVLEHFFDGPTSALREANRVLEDGGILVMTTPYPSIFQKASAPTTWLRTNRFVRRLFGKPPVTGPVSHDGYYETSFGRQQIRDYLGETGFDIVVQEPVGHAFNLWLSSRVFRANGSYYDTTPFAERVAGVMRRLAPWTTCFMSLTIARKRGGR